MVVLSKKSNPKYFPGFEAGVSECFKSIKVAESPKDSGVLLRLESDTTATKELFFLKFTSVGSENDIGFACLI